MRALVGDIGGTSARLAIVEIDANHVRLVRQRRFASRNYPGLAPIIRAFLADVADTPGAACFGVACPMEKGRCRGTNLSWSIDQQSLAADIGIPATKVINDLHAMGLGLRRLVPTDFVSLQLGSAQERGPIGLIAAGTGLGQAMLTWDGHEYRVHASEGGHASFSPRNELEIGLLRSLGAKFGHVSRERVVSGPGLENIYRFLVESGRFEEQAPIRMEMEANDAAVVIGQHGLAGTDAACVQALDMFAAAYGAQAGNFALTTMATGGVYVAGGIAVHVLRKLRDGTFMAAFRDKGRLSHILDRIPVRVVVNPHLGMIGAATAAMQLHPISSRMEPNMRYELA
jgi:glucokinase